MSETIITDKNKQPIFKGCHVMTSEQCYINIGEFEKIWRREKNRFIWKVNPSKLITDWMHCTIVYYMTKEDQKEEKCYSCDVKTFFDLVKECEQCYLELNHRSNE